jgi:hypothetical protein
MKLVNYFDVSHYSNKDGVPENVVAAIHEIWELDESLNNDNSFIWGDYDYDNPEGERPVYDWCIAAGWHPQTTIFHYSW